MTPVAPSVAPVRAKFLELQQFLTDAIEAIDGRATFGGDALETPGGGLSKPQVLADGEVIEKAAVQFTHSLGAALPPAATQRNPHLAGQPFQATAISLIIHPRNPFVPTTHMNLRFFIIDADEPVWYFGGGFDLTPYYPFREDVVHWHTMARAACPSASVYERLKDQCDDYFYLAHRGETRGVGGLFFDDWTDGGFEASFTFVTDVGEHFWRAYEPILRRRKDTPWTEAQERWMLIRRGRYAEFNLAIDRGTKYGLQSGRRVENVLASLPPRAVWVYDHHPEDGSPEAALISDFLKPQAWI